MYQQWLQSNINSHIFWIIIGAILLIVPIIVCIVEWKRELAFEDLELTLFLAALPALVGFIIVTCNLIDLINFINCPEGMLLNSILNMFS